MICQHRWGQCNCAFEPLVYVDFPFPSWKKRLGLGTARTFVDRDPFSALIAVTPRLWLDLRSLRLESRLLRHSLSTENVGKISLYALSFRVSFVSRDFTGRYCYSLVLGQVYHAANKDSYFSSLLYYFWLLKDFRG